MPPELPLYVASEGSGGLRQDRFRRYQRTYPNSVPVAVDMDACAISLGKREAVFVTNGALPCTIIVVHMSIGRGSLSHFVSTGDPQHVVDAVVAMVQQIRIDCNLANNVIPISIAFSAGLAGDDHLERAASLIRGLFLSTFVTANNPPGGVYGSCIYYPAQHFVAFMEDEEPHRGGVPFPNAGVKIYNLAYEHGRGVQMRLHKSY